MKAKLRRFAQWLHKWLALIAGVQILIWVLGGVLFAYLPFKSLVKGEAYLLQPDARFAGERLLPLERLAGQVPGLRAVATLNLAGRPVYRLEDEGGKVRLVDARSGQAWPAPDEAAIRARAGALYQGEGRILSVQRLAASPARRLVIVDELGGRADLWQVSYDDAWGSRLYFSAETGEFFRYRNDAWVLYDFFWRLHVMDYAEGADFNNGLLRVAAVLALVVALSGAVMLCYSRFLPARKRLQSP